MKAQGVPGGADQWLVGKATCGLKSPLVGFAQHCFRQLETTEPEKMGDFNLQVDSQARLKYMARQLK